MSIARIARILGRWWWFIGTVTISTIAGSILWHAVGPVSHHAEAELLLVLELPPDSEDRQFGIGNSRAQASSIVIEDLVRLARGRSFLREIVEALNKKDLRIDVETLSKTIDVFPLARGLRLELDWTNAIEAQAVINTAVQLLLVDQTRLYPSLSELGTLRLIDKTDAAIRPTFGFVFLDTALKTFVALCAAILIVLLADWRVNRIFADDIKDLLDTPIVGTVR